MVKRCDSCGAPRTAAKCEYCGTKDDSVAEVTFRSGYIGGFQWSDTHEEHMAVHLESLDRIGEEVYQKTVTTTSRDIPAYIVCAIGILILVLIIFAALSHVPSPFRP